MIPLFQNSKRSPLSLLLALLLMIPMFSSASNDNEAQSFKDGKQAIIKKDWATYNRSHQQLKNSTLLPYLEFYYYQERINESNPQEVLNFANKHANEPFANTLKSVLFKSRDQAKNYQFFLDNAQSANSLSLRCYLYNAQLQNSILNVTEFQKEWSNQLLLPNNCANVESFWLARNDDQTLIKNKVAALVTAGHLGKAASLLESLPAADRDYYQYFINLLNNPSSLTKTETFYGNASPLYTQVLKKWSSQNSLQAEEGLNFAKAKNLITNADYIKLRNRIAVFQAGRNDSIAPLQKILSIPESERDDQLIQWGFRLAAKAGDYKLALDLLSKLSPEAQAEDVWQYWLGRSLMETGNHTAARKHYEQIQNIPSFYGFLAADALQHNYAGINTAETKNDAATTLAPRFLMSLLLAKVNEEYFSRTKWREALNNSTKEEQEAGSIAAFNAGFYNLSLQAAARARTESGLKYRYPSAYLPIIKKYSDDFITEPVVLGLIRQESLFHEKAKSQASAYGLMQLLIPTAESVSNSLNESERESLYDPEANIRYGITYLKNLQENVGSCIPYLLASYNAGPHNVKKWIPKLNQPEDMALWIETIPFYETRGYVKNVLGNAVIYHALNDNPKRLSDYLQCEEMPAAIASDVADSDARMLNL